MMYQMCDPHLERSVHGITQAFWIDCPGFVKDLNLYSSAVSNGAAISGGAPGGARF